MEPDPLSLIVLALALLAVGLAVVMELALTMASRSEIRKRSEGGDRRAAIAERLLREPDQLFVASMLLTTAGLVAAGAALVRMLPAAATTAQVAWAVAAAWIGFAVVQVLGRAVVVRRPLPIALHAAPVMQTFSRLLWPFSIVLRRIGLSAANEEDVENGDNVFLSEEGLRLLMNVGDEEETILDSEKQMIAGILEMDETVTREVMVPRMDVMAMDIQTSLRQALDTAIDAGHSRIPVFEGNIDHIVGFLYAKDLLSCFRENRDDMPISTLLRPAYFVPASKKVNALLKEMQKRRVHVAMVVDEYGGTAGLVTIEDIIEEIVGEIQDEYDEEEDIFVQALGGDVYLLNARLDLYSLSKLLNLDVPDEDADTLGGLIYSELGHVPEPGESVEVADWRFIVHTLEGRRIDEVRAEPVTPVQTPARTEAEPAPAKRGATDAARDGLSAKDQSAFNYSMSK